MIRSLVKWPGGKGRVMSDLLPILPKADCLVEPFVGGASVFASCGRLHAAQIFAALCKSRRAARR